MRRMALDLRILPRWNRIRELMFQGSVFFLCRWTALEAATQAPPAAPPLPPTHSTSSPQVVLKDIHGPLEIASKWVWFGRLAVVLILAALIALAWWWWQRKKTVNTPSPRVVPPSERALRRLQEALGRIEDSDGFVTEVSEIARVYLEERFGLKAPERTTEEFLAELTTSVALESRHKQLLADFLTRCDLVKFARMETHREELMTLHGAAWRLVEETVPETTSPPPVLIPNPPAPIRS